MSWLGRKQRLIILAIVLSMILWLHQKLLRQQTLEIPVKVDVTHIPDNLVPLNSPPDNILFRVTGRGLDLLMLNFYNHYLEIDASDFIEGMNQVEVNEKKWRIPSHITIARAIPLDVQKIEFILDRIETLKRPVRTVFASREDSLFFRNYLPPQDVPDSVALTGPESVLDSIESIQTHPITRTQLESSTPVIELRSPNSLVTMNIKIISISRTNYIQKTLYGIPVENPYWKKYRIEPEKINLLVKGRKPDIETALQQRIPILEEKYLEPVDGEIRELDLSIISDTVEILDVSHESVTFHRIDSP